MKKKLLIWDFDGVIADTEKLWLKNRQFMLKKELGIDWNWKTVNQHLRGMSDQTKKENLQKLGIITDDEFWKKSLELDMITMAQDGFILNDGVESIFKMTNIKQCIATGGIWDKTMVKIKVVGIDQYFNQNQVFTADMVKHGKPEPDLFLYAAQQMGENPENTVIIEDSIAGLMAAIRAGCLPIAYINGDLHDNIDHLQAIKSLGIKHIFDDMHNIKKFLETLF